MLAFPQAKPKREIYLHVPRGFEVDGDEEYVLKLERNLYGSAESGQVFNDHLVERLKRYEMQKPKLNSDTENFLAF